MTSTLTTPLYYVNDKPHIGSVYTTLAVDTLARFKRLNGEDVVFITGCDEHGQKIQRTAESAGIEPQQHCDQISSTFASVWSQWQISNDRFIRTTDPRHQSIVEQFFSRVEANGNNKATGCAGEPPIVSLAQDAAQRVALALFGLGKLVQYVC